MRSPDQIVHSRACLTPSYALLPLEGFPPSRLPGFGDAEVFILATPRIGAGFVQYLVNLSAGSSGEVRRDFDVEAFYFVLKGDGVATIRGGEQGLSTGSYGLSPPAVELQFQARSEMQILVLLKRYEPSAEYPSATGFTGHLDAVPAEPWADNPSSRLQTLIPDEPAFDLAMNIFTFEPGCGLPVVETHVMEHGLWFLEGRGLYYLDHHWIEVEQNDFIWMGPYCPQSYVAAGPTPSRYLYYKNINREIPL
ncbi:MAG: (S)-ureidoglycine aminohydrolase [Planctomycetota bacterium]